MRYCTLADLLLAIPECTLVQLANDAPDAIAPDELIVERAVSQAEELIDGYLRGRYSLPLAEVPTVLRELTVNLARHWLYARRPEGGELPDTISRTYKAALDLLANIRDGKVTLGVATGAAAPERGPVRVRSAGRVFNAGWLDRF